VKIQAKNKGDNEMENKYNNNDIKCGDVVWAKIPKSEDPNSQVQSGWRPVLILGNSKGVKYSPVVQCIPITTQLKRTELPAHILIGGLEKESMSLAEQINTIDKHNIKNKICTLSKESMDWIYVSMLAQLGADPNRLTEKYNNVISGRKMIATA
jgi:mRNA interferase MazF